MKFFEFCFTCLNGFCDADVDVHLATITSKFSEFFVFVGNDF